ncbi:IS3 family transposase [Bacillus sp. DX4.1]|uniref:IS3 family transposase n=1 Tax=Bacillus sp. DX4.1 TaxID=3055867 RepID=UPI0025A2200F|nr:IS3 family transposase [Bacillus sp. DX4.1]MDM5186272.1 IS3 family transposase [Bacillus sp. DX4.1]MDM5187129.1 IS3 family transposase [Bacillus sp. DX4.1]MDM5190189.1 IS3 family transposase [Bacillus sp. DX4.1]MDM5190902.1 IS3 family transposase [Bacillus sp. DX4.1]
MTKYSLEVKLSSVTAYLNGIESFKDIAQKHSVDMTMLKKWVAKFRKHGLAGLQKTYTNYSVEFKMDVLKFINEMGASIAEATTVFNIPTSSTVWKWKHLFETQGIDALQPKEKGRPPMKKKPENNQQVEGSEEALKAEIERLRMENAYLKKLPCLNSRKGKVTEQDKAQIIYELRHEFKVIDLVKVADIPRSTYYYWVKRMDRPDKYHEVKEMIQQIFHKHQGRYGYRRITWTLRNQGIILNHKTVRRLMSEMNLKSLVRMKKYRSYRGKVGNIAPNILKRDFGATKPNEKWVTDVTEFHIHGEKLYLSPILDLYNGEIIAYNVEKRPVYPLVSKMLDKAFQQLKDGEFPILHSDQGWHYQMKEYQHVLKEKGITQSMSRKGNCLDNAVIENFFGLLKSELLYLQEFESMEHFKLELEKYIHYYNNDRIKTKLKGMSPVQYRTHSSLAA